MVAKPRDSDLSSDMLLKAEGTWRLLVAALTR